MTRKELIEQAFQKIATGDEEQRFLAIRLFKKALEVKRSPYDYQSEDHKIYDELINMYIILTELTCNIEVSKEIFSSFIFENITVRSYREPSVSLDVAIKSKNITYNDKYANLELDGSIIDFLHKDLPLIWLKSLKYDSLFAQYKDWKTNVEEEKAKALQIDKFFNQLDQNLLE